MTIRCACGKVEIMELAGGWVCASCFTRLNDLYRRTLGERAELSSLVRELEREATIKRLRGIERTLQSQKVYR